MSNMIGIVRKFDELGRITIPIEYRRYLGIDNKGKVEIKVTENDEIILTPYRERGEKQ